MPHPGDFILLHSTHNDLQALQGQYLSASLLFLAMFSWGCSCRETMKFRRKATKTCVVDFKRLREEDTSHCLLWEGRF